MKGKVVLGNLLDALDNGDVDAIAHCVNCQGVMGSGIALQIKERYPVVYEGYRFKHYKDSARHISPLGEILVCDIPEGGKVINLYAQDGYGRHKRQLNYDALADSLSDISLELPEGSIIGFPYLFGCDRAGGDWEVVTEIIEYFLSNYTVVYYKYVKTNNSGEKL